MSQIQDAQGFSTNFGRESFERVNRRFDKQRDRLHGIEAKIDNLDIKMAKCITMLATLLESAPTLGLGAPQGSDKAQETKKPNGRRLSAEQEYAPEMTYDEMFAARDARWKNGQRYARAEDLMFAFPKTMPPAEALKAAKRERYWMKRNGAIEYDQGSKRYAISPQWVERFVE